MWCSGIADKFSINGPRNRLQNHSILPCIHKKFRDNMLAQLSVIQIWVKFIRVIPFFFTFAKEEIQYVKQVVFRIEK